MGKVYICNPPLVQDSPTDEWTCSEMHGESLEVCGQIWHLERTERVWTAQESSVPDA